MLYNKDITDEGVMNMNLKEAFRFQNRLEYLIEKAENILDDEDCVTLTKRTYLYKKANPEAENETVTVIPDTEYYRQLNEMIEFAVYLLDQREKLSEAINKVKYNLPLDLDGEISLNRYRQRLAEKFRRMARIKSKEVTETNSGVDKCDVKRVTTINFNRNTVRKYAAQLSGKSDATSKNFRSIN